MKVENNQRAEKAKYIIEKAPIRNTIFLLVVPAILGSLVGQINFLLDSFFLNKVTYTSTETLQVAVAAAFPLSLVLLGLATIFAIGGSIYGSRALGEGGSEKARGIFSGTVVYGFLINVILGIILFVFLNPLLKLLGATSPETLHYAWDYAAIMIIGSSSLVLSFIFAMFARSEGKAGLVLFAILFQTITNIVLNYLFIIPLQMGTAGASLATVVSQFTQLGIIGVFLFSKKSNFQFTIHFKEKFTKKDLFNVLELGFPATLGIILLTVSAAILQVQANFYQDESLKAAIGVLIKFFTIFTMLIQAAVSGIQPVFSYSYGAQKKDRFLISSRAYLKVSTITGIVVAILLFIFPYTFSNILGFTGQTREYIKLGTYGFSLMLLIMPASFLQQIIFQSLGEPRYAVRIVLIRQIGIFIIVTTIFGIMFGISGVLLSQQIAIFIGSIMTLLYYKNKLDKLINKSFS